MAKHLPAFGWNPIIVRADERHYTEALDPALARLVPETIEQVRTRAFPAGIARWAGVGDIGLRGYGGYRQAIDELAQAGRIQAVFITGSPFYPMLLARHVRERLGLPVVLDFQDPWVSAEGFTRPYWSKGRMAHRLSVVLEPRALRHANFVTSVSDRQNDEMSARYPWLDRSSMAAIPIGGDPEDFDALRRNPPLNPQARLEPEFVNFVYVGTFLPRAGPLVRTIFGAIRDLRRDKPDLARRIRFNFVGTSNQPGGGGDHLVRPIAESEGVDDLVREHPPRVPFLEALSLLANADGLLMIGSDEPHYTASKIYPNLMAARPFLSIFHAASSAHAILSSAGGGLTYSFETVEELATMRPALAAGIARIAQEGATFRAPDPSAFEAFTARGVAASFASVLDRVVYSN